MKIRSCCSLAIKSDPKSPGRCVGCAGAGTGALTPGTMPSLPPSALRWWPKCCGCIRCSPCCCCGCCLRAGLVIVNGSVWADLSGVPAQRLRTRGGASSPHASSESSSSPAAASCAFKGWGGMPPPCRVRFLLCCCCCCCCCCCILLCARGPVPTAVLLTLDVASSPWLIWEDLLALQGCPWEGCCCFLLMLEMMDR